ncbi:ABC transporter ATP-binding protein, partial [candidate division KSB1 bacterium]|nr:ABC transporter ATP-binding protein [candidate division KSB1 bacterium]
AVDSALQLTGIASFADRHLDTLSGGERQIVFIAAAVAQGAGIMLLDEPTTFLDPKHQTGVYQILKRLNQELKITLLCVTHDINNAALQSDRVIILKNGAVMHSGNATDIMQNPILEPAYDKSFLFIQHPQTGQPIIAPEVV